MIRAVGALTILTFLERKVPRSIPGAEPARYFEVSMVSRLLGWTSWQILGLPIPSTPDLSDKEVGFPRRGEKIALVSPISTQFLPSEFRAE